MHKINKPTPEQIITIDLNFKSTECTALRIRRALDDLTPTVSFKEGIEGIRNKKYFAIYPVKPYEIGLNWQENHIVAPASYDRIEDCDNWHIYEADPVNVNYIYNYPECSSHWIAGLPLSLALFDDNIRWRYINTPFVSDYFFTQKPFPLPVTQEVGCLITIKDLIDVRRKYIAVPTQETKELFEQYKSDEAWQVEKELMSRIWGVPITSDETSHTRLNFNTDKFLFCTPYNHRVQVVNPYIFPVPKFNQSCFNVTCGADMIAFKMVHGASYWCVHDKFDSMQFNIYRYDEVKEYWREQIYNKIVEFNKAIQLTVTHSDTEKGEKNNVE